MENKWLIPLLLIAAVVLILINKRKGTSGSILGGTNTLADRTSGTLAATQQKATNPNPFTQAISAASVGSSTPNYAGAVTGLISGVSNFFRPKPPVSNTSVVDAGLFAYQNPDITLPTEPTNVGIPAPPQLDLSSIQSSQGYMNQSLSDILGSMNPTLPVLDISQVKLNTDYQDTGATDILGGSIPDYSGLGLPDTSNISTDVIAPPPDLTSLNAASNMDYSSFDLNSIPSV